MSYKESPFDSKVPGMTYKDYPPKKATSRAWKSKAWAYKTLASKPTYRAWAYKHLQVVLLALEKPNR